MGEEAGAPHKEVPRSSTAPMQLFPQVSHGFLATLPAPPLGRLGPHPWDLTPVHRGDPHGAPPPGLGRGGGSGVRSASPGGAADLPAHGQEGRIGDE